MTNYIDMSHGAERTHIVSASELRDRLPKDTETGKPWAVTIPDDAEMIEVEFLYSEPNLCHGRLSGHTAVCWRHPAVLYGWRITGDPAQRERAGLPPRTGRRAECPHGIDPLLDRATCNVCAHGTDGKRCDCGVYAPDDLCSCQFWPETEQQRNVRVLSGLRLSGGRLVPKDES